MTLINKEVNKV